MRIFTTICIVSIAAFSLLLSRLLTSKYNFQLHQNQYINGLAKHQCFALLIAIVFIALFLCKNPASKEFFQIGELSSIAEKEKWIGINGNSTWLKNGLQLLFFISLATGIFVGLGVMNSGSISNFQLSFIPFILLFSLTNSFAEEIIFRYAIIAGLEDYYPKGLILITSAILFGIPHFFGNPSGIVGVIMSGLLGYILCKATLETRGLSIAWGIHFVQDIIIFTGLLMMNSYSTS
ncbi:CPBP family intramembrane glutamic endopeptidase [Flavobacterium sp.]|uniref:CPBP family intramembrane glutamic endopeptidase n=1 Tax=Flavobacterium sp. TaxID=239 RepID=UPI002FDA2C3D